MSQYTVTLQNGQAGVVEVLVPGLPGPPGPAGVIPAGGSTGAVLQKASGTDYDLTWGTGVIFATQAEAEAGASNALSMSPLRTQQAIAYRLDLRTIAAGTGLTGGGTLGGDRTISLSGTTLASLAKADTSVQPSRAIATANGLLGGGTLAGDLALSIDLASQAEAEAGSAPTKIMSALRTSQAIDGRLSGRFVLAGAGLSGGGALNASVSLALSAASQASLALADTAVQPARQVATGVGLTGGGSLAVDRTISADIASQAEAEAGVVTGKLMTPERTAQSVAARLAARLVSAGAGLTGGGNLGSDLTLSLTSSSLASLAKADTAVQPARVVATGAGLLGGGSLSADRTLSADFASQAEAEAFLSSVKVMSPLRTSQAVEAKLAGRSVLAGTGMTGGGTLAGNVLLGLSAASQASLLKADTAVQPARMISTTTGLLGGGDLSADRSLALDFASQAEAEAGALDTKVMTPLKTAQLLAARVVDNLTTTSATQALSAAQGKVLQDTKAPLASPAFTGTPTAPTPSGDSNSTQLATTAFVQTAVTSAIVGQTPKPSCACATTANITLSGLQTIDGYTTLVGDRVLVKNQTASENNGIYVAASGAWTRATDFDASGDLGQGMTYFVGGGTQNGGTSWSLLTAPPYTLGVTLLTFTQTGSSSVQAGAGLSKSGTTLSVSLNSGQILLGNGSNVATAVTPSGAVTISNAGVTSIAAGAISDSHINVGAAIADTKLATISSIGKVANSATTATSLNTPSTIVLRDGTGNFSGTASHALQLANSRTIALSGDATGSIGFNGTADVTIPLTLASSGVTPGTYQSVTVNAKGLVTGGTNPTTLLEFGITDAAPLDSPALTGTPTAPTPATLTNTTAIATTAYVVNRIASDAPTKSGGGATGTWAISVTGSAASATSAATAGSVPWSGITGKPSDIAGYNITDAAPLTSPAFLGTPTAPTPVVGTNTAQLATTAYVVARIAQDAPTKSGTGANGTWNISISGSAASATTATTATNVPWTGITGKPTTLLDFGITDGAKLDSPGFTGTPTAPTPTLGTNNTRLATTAFVVAQIGNDAPTKTGVGASGTWSINITGSAASATNATTATTATNASFVPWTGVTGKPTTLSGYGIGDGAPVNSPNFTGTPTAPTPLTATNTTQLATTAYVVSRILQDAPSKTGGGASGTWGISITGSAASAGSASSVPWGGISGVPAASTSGAGIVQLVDSLTSSSLTQACTANAVRNLGSIVTNVTYSGTAQFSAAGNAPTGRFSYVIFCNPGCTRLVFDGNAVVPGSDYYIFNDTGGDLQLVVTVRNGIHKEGVGWVNATVASPAVVPALGYARLHFVAAGGQCFGTW